MKPSFWKGPARTFFVVWLVLFSFVGSLGSFRYEMATYRAIFLAEGVLDDLKYFVTLRRLRVEAEVRDIIVDLEGRVDGR